MVGCVKNILRQPTRSGQTASPSSLIGRRVKCSRRANEDQSGVQGGHSGGYCLYRADHCSALIQHTVLTFTAQGHEEACSLAPTKLLQRRRPSGVCSRTQIGPAYWLMCLGWTGLARMNVGGQPPVRERGWRPKPPNRSGTEKFRKINALKSLAPCRGIEPLTLCAPCGRCGPQFGIGGCVPPI